MKELDAYIGEIWKYLGDSGASGSTYQNFGVYWWDIKKKLVEGLKKGGLKETKWFDHQNPYFPPTGEIKLPNPYGDEREEKSYYHEDEEVYKFLSDIEEKDGGFKDIATVENHGAKRTDYHPVLGYDFDPDYPEEYPYDPDFLDDSESDQEMNRETEEERIKAVMAGDK